MGEDDTGLTDAEASGVTRREGPGTERLRRSEAAAGLPRGTLVGRYVLLDLLGEGGMGVVYRAYDPELDRKVAIKLLQMKPGGTQGDEQAWLLREAQALARLAHPNVVAVYDVGTLAPDRVFVAMELVEGETLRRWLRAQPRNWREVLPIMTAAGAGLCAAHAAGLVHRDFKPENVIVGADGRVRVMDFGLARLEPSPDAPASRISNSDLSRSPLSESLTQVGSVIGTPSYMAPELFKGRAADAATDQFAFGVALFEALFGTRPFRKSDLADGSATAPRVPGESRVPTRIQRAVLRAISLEREQRFASLEDLVAELAIDKARNTRKLVAAGAAVALVAAGVAVTFSMRPHTVAPCQGIDARLAGVWDPMLRRKIHDAFVATNLAYAEAAFERLDGALDAYARDWSRIANESCRATRVRRDQTEHVLTLRQACLDQRLAELGALTRILPDNARAIVDKAEHTAGELEPLDTCSNIALLMAPDQPPAALRAKLAPIAERIASAKAHLIVSEFLPGLTEATQALDAARKLEYRPFIAEAGTIRSAVMMVTGNSGEAADGYAEATWAALLSKRDDLAAVSALGAATVSADPLDRFGEAKLWLALSRTASKRAGVDRAFEVRQYAIEGVIAGKLGDYETAIAAHEAAFAASQRMRGPNDLAVWNDELILATTLTGAHRYDKARDHFEHALAMREKLVGPDHPDVALVLGNMALAYSHLGQDDKARSAHQRVIAIREKLYGKGNPILAIPLNNYADYLSLHHDYASALPLIERAHQLVEAIPGREHPTYHTVATTHAEVLGGLGRVAEARKQFDELLADEQRLHSPVRPVTLTARARLENAQKAWAAAATFATQAIEAYETAGGVENPDLVDSLVALAAARLGAGDRTAARPLVERAIAIGTKAGFSETDLRGARDLLAQLDR